MCVKSVALLMNQKDVTTSCLWLADKNFMLYFNFSLAYFMATVTIAHNLVDHILTIRVLYNGWHEYYKAHLQFGDVIERKIIFLCY